MISFFVCDFVRTLDRQSRQTLHQKTPNSWNKVDSECNKPLCSDVAGVQRILDPYIGNFVITSIV